MDFDKILQQAQNLKKDYEKRKEELNNKLFKGTSGGGMVKITIDGSGKAKNISLGESLKSEDIHMVEDLIVAAINNAMDHKDAEQKESMSGMGGDMNIPGLDKIF
jgi:DNA-binding YbaB/EbfC family protein